MEKKDESMFVHKKCAKALGGLEALPLKMSDGEKVEGLETIYSLVAFNLFDNVFR